MVWWGYTIAPPSDRPRGIEEEAGRAAVHTRGGETEEGIPEDTATPPTPPPPADALPNAGKDVGVAPVAAVVVVVAATLVGVRRP